MCSESARVAGPPLPERLEAHFVGVGMILREGIFTHTAVSQYISSCSQLL